MTALLQMIGCKYRGILGIRKPRTTTRVVESNQQRQENQTIKNHVYERRKLNHSKTREKAATSNRDTENCLGLGHFMLIPDDSLSSHDHSSVEGAFLSSQANKQQSRTRTYTNPGTSIPWYLLYIPVCTTALNMRAFYILISSNKSAYILGQSGSL